MGVKHSLGGLGLALGFVLFGATGATAQIFGASDSAKLALFRHETHREVDCQACHDTPMGDEEHPDLTLTDCQSCHHADPANNVCQRCHAPADARVIALEMTRTLDIEIGSIDRPTRELPMRHSSHEDVRCQSCHSEGVGLSAVNVDCASCHESHHHPTTRCRDCHEAPAASAHNKQVHLGCGGAGCHENASANIKMVPRTRAFCLVCHDEMSYHKPGEACASCHRLPPPRPAGGQ